jgi:hypothetical protein
MYYSYSYSSMKLKPEYARGSISSTGSYTYSDWKSQLSDSSWRNWPKFCQKFGETFQFALLRGMTVIGIACSDWDSLFGDVYNAVSPFTYLPQYCLKGGSLKDWDVFADIIAKWTSKSPHYPAGCPVWLFPYGYDQKQYLQDLAIFWDNIHDDYYRLWETAQIGGDSPEVTRLKYLGNVARKEIDQVAQHSTQYLDSISTLPDSWPVDPYVQGVEELFDSLEWVYLTHRYEEDNLGILLRLLTLSGLDPSWWRRYIFHLLARNQAESSVLQLLAGESDSLFEGVNEITEYANEKEAPVGEPPFQPTYLKMFGYTQEEYLEDLEEVYDEVPDDRYDEPWPDNEDWVMEKPPVEQGSLHHAVAIMGTTAGAIEWIVQKGLVDG